MASDLNLNTSTLCVFCGTIVFGDAAATAQLSLNNDIIVKREVEVTNSNISAMVGDSRESVDDCYVIAATDVQKDKSESISDHRNDGKGQQQMNEKEVSTTPCRKWTGEEKSVYQWFVRVFRAVLLMRKKKCSGWDGDSGKDPFPFCSLCKNQILGLMELQRKLAHLERRIKDGIRDLKNKSKCCEDSFIRSGIYVKDVRYRRARKPILSFRSGAVTGSKKVTNIDPTRKSTRNRGGSKNESKNATSANDSSSIKVDDPLRIESSTAIVLLSASDKETADKRLLQSEDIKPEVVDDCDYLDWQNEGMEDIFEEQLVDDISNDRGCFQKGRNSMGNVEESPSVLTTRKKRGVKKKSDRIRRPCLKPTEDYQDEGKEQNSNKDINENGSKAGVDTDIYLPKINKRRGRKRKDAPQPLPTMPTKQSKSRRKQESVDLYENLEDIVDENLNESDDDLDVPKQHKNRKKPEDEDWTPEIEKRKKISNENDISAPEQGDDDDEEYYDTERDFEARKDGKVKVDTEKRTLTYRNIVFRQVEPFESNKYQCSECGGEVQCYITKRKNTTMVEYLRPHYLKVHSNLFACRQCDFHGTSKSNLAYHVDVAHKNRPYRPQKVLECPICQRPTTLSHYKVHLWSHKNLEEKAEAIARGDKDLPYSAKKAHQCDECGRRFNTQHNLRKHKEAVHCSFAEKQKRMELCQECGGTFLNLRLHLKQVHGIGGSSAKIHKCLEPGCGKEFRILSHLAKHKDAVHRKIRAFKCHLCPRSFNQQNYLISHLNLHNNLRPFQCQFCPSAFGRKSNLTRHIDTYHVEGCCPKRKSFLRGPTMLAADVRSKDLKVEGKYLPPSALATWAAGREPTSHFPVGASAGACSDSTIATSTTNQ